MIKVSGLVINILFYKIEQTNFTFVKIVKDNCFY